MLGLVLLMTLAAGSAGRNIPVLPFRMVDLAARVTVQIEQAPTSASS